MSRFAGIRKMRAFFSLTAVIVLFLGLSSGLLALRQKELLHELEQAHAARELDLMGTLAREALIRRDYVTIEQFFNSWGLDSPEIVSIQAVAPNGYTIALYEKEGEAVNTFEAARDIFHFGKKLITITMVKDLSVVDSMENRLLMQGAAALVLISAALGAALWFTVRRTAILPMERMIGEHRERNQVLEADIEERTADLVREKEATELEREKRRGAEETLRRSKEELARLNEDRDNATT